MENHSKKYRLEYSSSSQVNESSSLLASVFRKSPSLVVFALDRNYRYVAFNEQHRRAMSSAWGREIAIGINILDVIGSGDDQQKAKACFDRALSGESFDLIEAYGDESLSRNYWHTYWSPIYEENEVVGLTCLVANVSEQKQTEEKLKRSLSLTEAILESIDNGILVVSTIGDILRMNSKFTDMWHIPPELINSRDDRALLTYVLDQLIDPDAFLCKVQELYNKPEVSSEDLLEFKDGRVFERTSNPMIIDGKPMGRVWSFLDISARKRAERQIQLQQERLALALEASGNGIWDMNVTTSEISVNNRFLEMLGLPTDKHRLKFDFIYELVHPDDRGVFSSFYQVLEQTCKGSHQAEARVLHSDGTWRWILVRYKIAEVSPRGVPVRVIGNNTDTTERHRREEELNFLSTHDKLTGLYNRLYAERYINTKEITDKLPVTLVLGDVNGLKLINDTFGHVEGDRLLISFSQKLNSSVGNKGVVARWGGDEFIIILPGFGDQETRKLIDRIQKECGHITVNKLPISVALGHSTRRYMSQTLEEVMRKAEERMYHNKLIEGRSARSAIIATLRETLAAKTHETEEHCQRMQTMALKVAEHMGLPDNMRDDILLLAMLHDIGKIGVPETILTKPGTLTPEERAVIQKHSEIGFRIANASYEITHIAEGILSHHEWWNGKGYPQGLKGAGIPLISRIISVIDAYDAMTSYRVYRKALTPAEAIEELKQASGTQFDPDIVDIVVKVV